MCFRIKGLDEIVRVISHWEISSVEVFSQASAHTSALI